MKTTEYSHRIENHRNTLYRIAYCYVKNEQDALDIVGEAVYKGLIKINRLRDPDQFEGWMNRIVVNTALDHLRSNKRKPTCEALPELLPEEESSLGWEEQIDLYQALDSLEPEERTYIILRFFQELSFREIAEITDKPETTVKAKVYRILKKLRKQLSH